MMKELNLEMEDEKQIELLRNKRDSKKTAASRLNQKNLSAWELDELFLNDGGYEEEF